MAFMPKPTLFGLVPVSGTIPRQGRKMLGLFRFPAFTPCDAKVFASVHALEIVEPIVDRIPVFVMDMTAAWDWAKSVCPYVTMKPLTALAKVFLVRPSPIQTAVEKLRKLIEVDRISVPFARDCADFHPSPVANK